MSVHSDVEVDQDTAPEPMPKPTPAPVGNFAERDVDPAQALTEAQQESHVPTAAKSAPEPPKVDVVDILAPKSAPKQWLLGPSDMQMEFIQRRMSFVGKMQWFALVGGVMDKALGGANGISVNELLTTPGERGQFTAADLRDADTFVRALGKLMTHAPEFLLDSYCIWLSVPEHQRKLVKEIMSEPEENGGLTDDQGLEIIEVFIDQNFDALADFFGDKIGALRKRVEQRMTARNDRIAK